MKNPSVTAVHKLGIWFLALLACLSAASAQKNWFNQEPRIIGEDEMGEKKLRFDVKPLQGGDMDQIEQDSKMTKGLKMWTYNIKSTRKGSKGQAFKGVMVGNSPITTSGTTTTTVYVVPLIIQIGSHTFDPTVPDSSCLGGVIPLDFVKLSPMVLAYNDFTINGVDVGVTQYSDAFQRANFWKDVSAKGGTYHNKLNYKFLPAMTLTPDNTQSVLYSISGCTSVYGGVDVNWLDFGLKLFIIPSLASQGVGPTNLVTFMLYNTTMYNSSPSDCCIGGYHGAYGSPVQTYSPFQYDSAGFLGTSSEDTAIMSHEINEWQDDPLGNNPVPAWGHVGQVSGCQTNLEVGDPLTGTDYPPVAGIGIDYHLQELAFYSWFYGSPSLGAGGKYSDNGTFKSAQGACK
jgi:hypothetical protein